ncbi:hypothetical protein EV121DRAFT_294558 [Schizophyllum commune]
MRLKRSSTAPQAVLHCASSSPPLRLKQSSIAPQRFLPSPLCARVRHKTPPLLSQDAASPLTRRRLSTHKTPPIRPLCRLHMCHVARPRPSGERKTKHGMYISVVRITDVVWIVQVLRSPSSTGTASPSPPFPHPTCPSVRRLQRAHPSAVYNVLIRPPSTTSPALPSHLQRVWRSRPVIYESDVPSYDDLDSVPSPAALGGPSASDLEASEALIASVTGVLDVASLTGVCDVAPLTGVCDVVSELVAVEPSALVVTGPSALLAVVPGTNPTRGNLTGAPSNSAHPPRSPISTTRSRIRPVEPPSPQPVKPPSPQPVKTPSPQPVKPPSS